MSNPESHSSTTCPVCGAPRDTLSREACPHCLMRAAMQPTEGSMEAPSMAVPSIEDVAAAFPQLEVIALIGQGGMGCVFKARQPRLNRLVALKLLPASLAQRDPAFAGRFEREGQLLARLHHPNIVAVHDSGTAGEFFYLVMEYVDGVNLRQAMRAQRFTAQQALAIVPLICDALQYAHDEGVLHRDIKPENILLDARGRVKLADFGIAKLIAETDLAATGSAPAGADLTHSSAALGTPSYMAPEQRESPQDVDHRADIYSLGVVFYELLTGELPRERFTPPSERSEADPRIDPIVRQALEKDRDRRQRSAGEVRTQVTALRPGEAGKEPRPRYIAAILMLVLAVVAPLITMGRVDASTQLESAAQLARIKQEQQRVVSLSAQLGDAQANAGRAASRAGNSALPAEFRNEARREQEEFEKRAEKLRIDLALANGGLSDLTTARTGTDRRSWLLFLGVMLPFAAGGLILLARNASARAAFIAGGVLLAFTGSYFALLHARSGPGSDVDQQAGRPSTPNYATILNSDGSVLLAHDDVDLHYAVFYPGTFTASNSGSQNRHGRVWLDEGAIKLASGRSFGLRRDSANDLFLTINGVEYDLRRGRLFVLRDNGTIVQREVHPTLEEARSSARLGELAREGLTPTAIESAGTESALAKGMESWSYSPRYLTLERLSAWIQSPSAVRTGWSSETSVAGKGGLITVAGPREHVRRAATLVRALDQPEPKSIADLPYFNMDPDSFTRMKLPDLMARSDFEKAPVTESLLAALKEAGVSASQLGKALSAHVLELDNARFVNQGVPFESIIRSPGASTYYEVTIPCADRPGQPLTLRIERTTQKIGTQSKFDAFAPWLIEKAKAISERK